MPTVQNAPRSAEPDGLALAPWPSYTPQAIPAANAWPRATPQARPAAPSGAGPAPHKRWSLVSWVKSLPKSEPTARPYLPAVMFPTTYQASGPMATAQASPQPSCQRSEPSVRPAPQAVPQPASVQPPAKKCFSWVGKGPVTGFFRKLKAWGRTADAAATTVRVRRHVRSRAPAAEDA